MRRAKKTTYAHMRKSTNDALLSFVLFACEAGGRQSVCRIVRLVKTASGCAQRPMARTKKTAARPAKVAEHLADDDEVVVDAHHRDGEADGCEPEEAGVDGGREDVELPDEACRRRDARHREQCDHQEACGQQRAVREPAHIPKVGAALVLKIRDRDECRDVREEVDGGVEEDALDRKSVV